MILSFFDAIAFLFWSALLFAFPIWVGLHFIVQLIRYAITDHQPREEGYATSPPESSGKALEKSRDFPYRRAA